MELILLEDKAGTSYLFRREKRKRLAVADQRGTIVLTWQPQAWPEMVKLHACYHRKTLSEKTVRIDGEIITSSKMSAWCRASYRTHHKTLYYVKATMSNNENNVCQHLVPYFTRQGACLVNELK